MACPYCGKAAHTTTEYNRGRAGTAYNKMKYIIKRDGMHVCYICSEYIDMDIPYTHAMSWTMDHVLPLSHYPCMALDMSNIREAHRSCNSSKGNRTLRRNSFKQSRNW